MKKRKFALATALSALPFASIQAAEAAPSDCWVGDYGETLDHYDCDVVKEEDYDGVISWVVNDRMRITLWGDDNNNPTTAWIEDLNSGDITKGLEWWFDDDNDVRIKLRGRGGSIAFRNPTHPLAATGRTPRTAPDSTGGRPTIPASTYRAGSNGLRQGDLSDTPFRF